MTQEDLLRALQELGDSDSKVSDTLQLLECKGARALGSSCPVAVYLKKRGFRQIEVIPTHTSVGDMLVENPAPVTAFILKFDEGDIRSLDLHANDT
jgi:hypothetical protein